MTRFAVYLRGFNTAAARVIHPRTVGLGAVLFCKCSRLRITTTATAVCVIPLGLTPQGLQNLGIAAVVFCALRRTAVAAAVARVPHALILAINRLKAVASAVTVRKIWCIAVRTRPAHDVTGGITLLSIAWIRAGAAVTAAAMRVHRPPAAEIACYKVSALLVDAVIPQYAAVKIKHSTVVEILTPVVKGYGCLGPVDK